MIPHVSQLRFGQLDENKASNGIVRCIDKNGIWEGYLSSNTNYFLFIRNIMLFNKTEILYSIGWRNSNCDLHGFNKLVEPDGSIKEGLYEKYEFRPDGKVTYDKNSQIAKRFAEEDYVIQF